jgi:hypothetical protein
VHGRRAYKAGEVGRGAACASPAASWQAPWVPCQHSPLSVHSECTCGAWQGCGRALPGPACAGRALSGRWLSPTRDQAPQVLNENEVLFNLGLACRKHAAANAANAAIGR